MTTVTIAFICVHNSCRSQMAEAIAKHKQVKGFQFFSAGTQVKDRINSDAVEVIKELYQVDMELEQQSKLISQIPPVDIVITMGCNVNCPYLPSKHREDWGLEDPSGKAKDEFIQTAQLIDAKIDDLLHRVEVKEIEL